MSHQLPVLVTVVCVTSAVVVGLVEAEVIIGAEVVVEVEVVETAAEVVVEVDLLHDAKTSEIVTMRLASTTRVSLLAIKPPVLYSFSGKSRRRYVKVLSRVISWISESISSPFVIVKKAYNPKISKLYLSRQAHAALSY